MIAQLPEEIAKHLPNGYQPTPGVWFVLPESDAERDGINTVNSWLRAEDWYPKSLRNVVWFGDDGTGNFLGWDPKNNRALLWNPEDGEQPWKVGSVSTLWQFIQNGYKDAT